MVQDGHLVDSKGKTRTRQERKTEWFAHSGTSIRQVEGHLASASVGLPEDESNQLEPFDLGRAMPFEARLVAGWEARNPSVGGEIGESVLRQEVAGIEASRIMRITCFPGTSARCFPCRRTWRLRKQRLFASCVDGKLAPWRKGRSSNGQRTDRKGDWGNSVFSSENRRRRVGTDGSSCRSLFWVLRMSAVVQCESCGGSVVYDAAIEASRCIFCGSTKMGVPKRAWMRFLSRMQHSRWRLTRPMPMANTETGQMSWWNPKELRQLSIQLQLLYVPAWWIRGEVESHWSGLVRAATKSGKRPTSGISKGVFEDMVPASQGLSEEELAELHPFRMTDQNDWDSVNQGGSLRGARFVRAGRTNLGPRPTDEPAPGRHSQRGRATVGGVKRTGGRGGLKLFMLPVYIGAFQFPGIGPGALSSTSDRRSCGRPSGRLEESRFRAGRCAGLWGLIAAAML